MSRTTRNQRLARQSRTLVTDPHHRRLRMEPLEDRRMLAIFVDNLIDEADGSITDGDISLRDAIALAPAGETINFVSGGTIDLTLGELVIDKDLTISAGSGLQLTIDAQNNSRIFNITGGSVGISGLTLTRGTAYSGGAISNLGSLTITSSTITSSNASGGGGGILNGIGAVLNITDTTISGNTVDFGGGGGIASIRGTLSIGNSTISNNNSTEGGGILVSQGSASITASTISGNNATFGGGAALRNGSSTITGSIFENNTASTGGGLSVIIGSADLSQTTIRNNQAVPQDTFAGYGGGVSLYGSTITGGLITGNQARLGGGVWVPTDTAPFTMAVGTNSITGSTISGNVAEIGGGMASGTSLAVFGTHITGNTAEYSGGGIYSGEIANSSPDLTIAESTISGNTVTDAGGVGGGIANQSGELRIERSTLSENSASGLGPGGGIYNAAGSARVVNSTLSGNSAGFGQGGGIFNAASLEILYSTLTDNTASSGGGGISNNDAGVAALSHSIVSGNFSGLFVGSTRNEIFNSGAITVDDYNLFGNSGRTTALSLDGVIPGATDIVATSNGTLPTPLAGIIDTTLADNGGPTLTHALAAGSPAINAGDPAFSTPPDSDQRGLPYVRQSGSRIDIGAVEDQPQLLIVTTLNDESNGAGEFSLREAIETANMNMGPDVISFDPGLAGGTIDLTLGELNITDNVTIVGLGADRLTIDGGGNSRVFDVGLNRSANFSGLTITGGAADNGAGIRSAGNTNVTLTAMVVTGNAATQDGGGVFSFSNLTIVDSTISGNTAGDDGGGLWIYNDDQNFGERAIISNSTVSGNTATGSGGGIYVDFGEARIRHSTITQNTAAVGDGVLSRASSLVSTRFRSSIVADNTDDDDVASVGFGLSSILSDGYNLVGGGNSNGRFIAAGDQSGVFDPQLSPLSDNGGPTPTHAVSIGGPAHDAGDPADVAGQGIVRTFDQRRSGFDRVKGAAIDVGAFEAEPHSADFDSDGDVDGADFLAWQRGVSTSNPSKSDGDADNDADVDVDDLAVWQEQYGEPTPLITVVAMLATSNYSQQGIDSGETLDADSNLIDVAQAWVWIHQPESDPATDVVFEETIDEALASNEALVAPLAIIELESASEEHASSSDTDKSGDVWLSDKLLESVFG